eukprot:jgi/Galph1/1580/GphlegSOOS_G264.1
MSVSPRKNDTTTSVNRMALSNHAVESESVVEEESPGVWEEERVEFHPEKSFRVNITSQVERRGLHFPKLASPRLLPKIAEMNEYSGYVGNETAVKLPLIHPPQPVSPRTLSNHVQESQENTQDWNNEAEVASIVCKVIAFVNCKSGGQRGKDVVEALKLLLGEDAVFDLGERGVDEKELEKWRVLVCGGDGTFSWVAGALQFFQFSPAIAPVPLGTGNDLSRSLGWGSSYPGRARLPSIIECVKKAYFCYLDVWHVKISSDGNFPPSHSQKDILSSLPKDMFCHNRVPHSTSMVNSLSLGVDAEVEMRFNEERWRNPDKFKGQQLNVFLHIWHGLKGFFGRHKPVKDCIRSFQVDGVEIPISHSLESIIILNIPNYAAGGLPYKLKKATERMLPFKESKFSEAAVDDGLLEIVGLRNLLHIIRIRMGAGAVKLAQGKHIRIELVTNCRPLAFQVDGEPWRQNSGVIEIGQGKPQPVLVGPYHQVASRKHAQFTAGIRRCFAQ